MTYRRVSSLKTADDFRAHLAGLGVALAFDETVDPAGALARPNPWRGGVVGNRFAVLPMEGWRGRRRPPRRPRQPQPARHQ
jgi:hypothetical protein